MVLLGVDYSFSITELLRVKLIPFTSKIQRIVNWPSKKIKCLNEVLINGKYLKEECAKLQQELLVANIELQKIDFLEYENSQLSELLGYKSEFIKEKVLIAELTGLVADKFDHSITINKGQKDGVYVGQPVLGKYGLVGQVASVQATHSRIIPITSKKSAIPVTVLKSGLQLIAVGTGQQDFLELIGVTETSGISIGDILVTSKVGGIFFSGYQVGVVSGIEAQDGERFLKVLVTPRMKINYSAYLLLIWQG